MVPGAPKYMVNSTFVGITKTPWQCNVVVMIRDPPPDVSTWESTSKSCHAVYGVPLSRIAHENCPTCQTCFQEIRGKLMMRSNNV